MTQPPRRRVAAFDFDGTLTTGDTLVPFLYRVSGPRQFAMVSAKLGLKGSLRRIPITDRDHVKELMIRDLLGGREEADLRALGREYATGILANRMNDAVVQRLRDHVDRGDEVLLVSASLVYYLDPIAEHFGIDAVIAVEPTSVDGTLDGSLTYPNVRAEQKAIRLSEWLSAKNDSDDAAQPSQSQVELWAYGNSSGDHELLDMADHAFWLGSNKKRPGGVAQFAADELA